jgi:BolA family transcriptional regulator, general stress-responsive regulator
LQKEKQMGPIKDQLDRILQQSFTPTLLDVEDFSEEHHGHAGYRDGGQTHFRVKIVSPAFEGLSRIDRARRVHEALGPDLLHSIHALTLTLKTPGEAG